MIDLSDLGAVGGYANAEQAAQNMAAIEEAVEIGGLIYVPFDVRVREPIECLQGIQGTVRFVGGGMMKSVLRYQSDKTCPRFIDLTAARMVQFENLSIHGGIQADVVLYCGRNENRDTAGWHRFTNTRIVYGLIASYLNYGSEGNFLSGCIIQGSPVSMMLTGHEPLMANIAVPGANPVDWESTWVWSSGHHFVGCSLGDRGKSTRCGIMSCGAIPHISLSTIQTVFGSEAAVIIDATHQMLEWSGIQFDGCGAPVSMQIGRYAPEPTRRSYQNRINLHGVHLTAGADSEYYIMAWNLRNSKITQISEACTARPKPKIWLHEPSCTDNQIDCRYSSGAEIEVVWGDADNGEAETPIAPSHRFYQNTDWCA